MKMILRHCWICCLKFKEQGMTSIIISHKLNEISYVADKITVIRDGSTIETLDKKKDDFSEQRIIQGMVGREMTDRFPKRPDVKSRGCFHGG